MLINVADHHALEILLDELQGTARARALTPDDVARLARDAEGELESFGIPYADRKGCEYTFFPLGYTTRHYASKPPRADATWIRLRREADGWFLVEAERRSRRMTSMKRPAGQLWLTAQVHEELVKLFARQFLVLA
jgi:hypothetical protein